MGLRGYYRVVVAADVGDLEVHVTELMIAGWECQGGITWYAGWIDVPDGDGAKNIEGSFMQAMIKLE